MKEKRNPKPVKSWKYFRASKHRRGPLFHNPQYPTVVVRGKVIAET